MRGFGGLVLLVLVVGTIVRYWWVIAAVVGIVLLGFLLYRFAVGGVGAWMPRSFDAEPRLTSSPL